MIRLSLIATILVLLTTSFSYAKEINDEGAEQLKTLFSDYINDKKNEIEARGGSLKIDGDITVEQADKYYAVTLPALHAKAKTGEGIKIGLTAINATPTDSPNDWKMSIALPNPITFTNSAGKSTARVNIGSQRAGGLWSGKLNNFSKLVAKYEKIKIVNAKNQLSTLIDKIDIFNNLEETQEKKWSGLTTIALHNLLVRAPESKDTFKIGSLILEGKVKNIEPGKQETVLQQIQNLSEENSNKNAAELIKSISGEIESNLTINNLQADITKTKSGVPIAFAFNKGFFNLGYKTEQEDKISGSIKLGYNGLRLSGAPNNFAPTDINFDIALNNLPISRLVEEGQNTLTDNETPDAQKVAALQTMLKLPPILSDAGTILNINNSFFGNGVYHVNMNGKFKANPTSSLGTTGVLNTQITGLDSILKSLSGKSDAKSNQAVSILQMLQLISEKEGNTNRLDLTLTEDAKILINGKDVSGLMSGGALQ